MVYRVYVEKKQGFKHEANSLLSEVRDLLEIMQATTNGTLSEDLVKWKDGAATCVVMASNGYPQKYESGYEIKISDLDADENVFIAGAKLDNGVLKTAGGRVLGAVATAENLAKAVEKAYKVVDKISFDNAYFRKDIGKRARSRLEK